MNQNGNQQIEAGTVFEGRYRIERVLGAGGMGEVYVASHTALERKVAVKRLHAQYTSDPDVVQRFIQEAKLAASIGHDNICEVIDIGTTDDGAPYLVMPILEGCTLCELLDSTPRFPIKRLADIICQTLSALQAAHGARIVHRDLKPDNIFITSYGDREDFVKLLDFGISKILDQDSVSQLTQTGTVLGTPYYMAPEQARGARQIDQRVDIYAMGVILYEGLTGTRPYEGHSYNEIMFKILAEPFHTPRVVDPSVPPAIERVVLKAMSKDPDERYENAEAMRDALKTALLETGTRISTPPALTSSGTQFENDNAFAPTAMAPQEKEQSGRFSDMETNTLEAAPGPSGKRILLVSVAAAIIVVALGIPLYATWGKEEAIPTPQPIPTDEPVEETASATEPPPPEPVPLPPVNLDIEDTSKADEADAGPKRPAAKRPKKPKPKVVITEAPPKPKPPKPPKEKDDSIEGRFGTKFAPVYEE